MRALVLDRTTGEIGHRHFYEIAELLRPGDCLVLNNSRVLPARLLGHREPTGGAVEVLLLRDKGDGVWECLTKPGRKTHTGTELSFGDGELTAGKLLKLLAESGKKMSELNSVYAQYPQVLVNVTANAAQKAAYKEDEVLAGFIENEQQKLMGMGRVLVRVSGTEPKIRVMVEGQDLEAIHRCADRIVEKINKRILKQ